MAPRTRATTTTTSAPPNLAAAPRRRVRITPLDKDDSKLAKADNLTVPITRATRSKASIPEIQDEPSITTTKSTSGKPRGRPRKTDATVDKDTVQPVEKLAEKPKRATRSTRATATTVSSEAKGKPTSRTTRAANPTSRTTRAAASAPDPKGDSLEPEPIAIFIAPLRKKVTFQVIEDDKENLPIAKGSKKNTATKSTKSASTTGLKAKPVRNPTTATRASKRTKEHTSDDEEEQKPNKIRRILTPKKITQVHRPLTPEDASDDELSGRKTPVRDLSLSPKRPQTSAAVEAIATALSPVKKLDFAQSVNRNVAKQTTDAEVHATLTSPARRLPTSPAKLFSQSTLVSSTKIFKDEPSNNLASPARRPVMSPIKEGEEQSSRHIFGNASKLLFPNAHKTSQTTSASGSSNLLQSPKRSVMFDPARIFAHSAVKPQSTNLSKSGFFSSPAKRTGMFSPVKTTTTPDTATKSVQLDVQSPELSLNDLEVTESMEGETIEMTATSYQRGSVSPLRTYKLTEDEMQVDFDDSVLEVRSPLKVSRSPVKAIFAAELKSSSSESIRHDEDFTEVLSSAQSTPRVCHAEGAFVSLQDMNAGDGSKVSDIELDLTMTEVDDDTIDLADIAAEGTPRLYSTHDGMNVSLDELAQSPQVDVVAKYLRTPGTPATIHEHELTNMISSPVEQEASPTIMLHEHELTGMMSAPGSQKDAPVQESPASIQERSSQSSPTQLQNDLSVERSPVSLHEHELTRLAFTPKSGKPAVDSSPVALHENELTKMLSSPVLTQEHGLTRIASPQVNKFVPEQSPVSLNEHELTNMLSSPHLEDTIIAQVSPASLHEHELTNMMSSPLATNVPQDHSPASLHEHELSRMLSSPALDKVTTPNLPIARKFNFNTVVTKVPLKPEGQESPFKLSVKKRKRPLSLGGQPDFVDIIPKPFKSSRSSITAVVPAPLVEATATPASVKSTAPPATKTSTIKTARRVISTPNPARTPLAAVINGVLTGAVIYVDVRTSEGADASAIYIELLSGLGAKVVLSITDASLLTHIVFKDGNPKTLEKIRRASIGDGINVKIVGVSWPLDCEAKKEWIDEEAYLLNLTPTDHVAGSLSRSAKRKSMEPSMLVIDGSGSVKRARSKGRASMRRSSIKPFVDEVDNGISTDQTTVESATPEDKLRTPMASAAKRQSDLEKNSLTAAWKSMNATQNLGEDTPARRTLELLQKSYALEQDDWDSTILSNSINDDAGNTDMHDETTSRASPKHTDIEDQDADFTDKDLLETGLTPAPYRTQAGQSHNLVGSAPAKQRGVGLMSYRERVEEMERREMRDNAIGVEGGKGRGIRGKGRRVTMFGGEV